MANETRRITIESILGGHAQTTHFAGSDQFRASLGIDPALPADDSGSATKGVIASGLLRPTGYNKISNSNSSSIAQAPMWLIQNPKNQYTYIYDTQGSVYSIDVNLTNFTSLSDAGQMSNARGNGSEYYDNYVYFSKNTTIARYGPLDGTPVFNGDYWAGTLGKTALIDTTYPVNGTAGAVLSYYKLDGNSNDAIGGRNGTDRNVTYAAGNGILVSGAAFTTVGSPNTVYDNLVAFWKMDESSSGDATDAIGSRTLTSNGTTPVSRAAGKLNNGAVFTAANLNYFSRSNEVLGIGNAWSISGWIKTASTGSALYILGFDVSGSNENRIFIEKTSADKIRCVAVAAGSTGYKDYTGTTTTITSGTYHHIAVTWDGTNLLIYVNGVSQTLTKTLDQPVTQTNQARTISLGSTSGSYSSIEIDEFGYFSTNLSAANITTIYNAGAALALYSSSSITNLSPVNLPSACSISAWIKTTQTPSGANPHLFGYVSSGGATYPQFKFNIDNGAGTVSFYCSDSSGNTSQITSSALNNGAWHHLVGVRSGNTVMFYVDGVLVGSNTVGFTGNFNSMVTGLGHNPYNAEDYFGSLDECGLFSVALSSLQIGLLYASGAALSFPFTTLGTANSGSTLRYPNHVLHRHSDGKLYIADVVGNQGTIHYISTKKTTVEGDTDDASTFSKLQVGYGLYPTAMESYGSDLVIAFYEGTGAGGREPTAKLAFWDTISQNINSIIWVEFPDNIITGLKNINGVLYLTSGVVGQPGFRVSRFVGGYTVEEVFYCELGTAPFAGGIDGDASRLLFASASVIPAVSACVFSLGLQKASLGTGLFNIASFFGNLATALTIPQRPATSPQNGFSFYTPLVGWDTGQSAGEVGIFNAEYSNNPCYWWSQMYRLGQPFKITKIRIPLATPVSSNTVVAVKIYTDEGENNKLLTEINSINFSGKKNIVYKPENLTGDHNFWMEIKWSGSDLCVISLPITIEYELIDD